MRRWRVGLVFGVLLALLPGKGFALNCNLDGQGDYLPTENDFSALLDIILGGNQSQVCLGGVCDFDQNGVSPNVGDAARLLTLIANPDTGICPPPQPPPPATGQISGTVITPQVFAKRAGVETDNSLTWLKTQKTLGPLANGSFPARQASTGGWLTKKPPTTIHRLSTQNRPETEASLKGARQRQASQRQAAWAAAKAVACEHEDVFPGVILVKVREGVDLAVLASRYGLVVKMPPNFLRHARLEASGKDDGEKDANAHVACNKLQAEVDLEYAELSVIVRPSFVPNDLYYPLQWHFPAISLPKAWDVTSGSENVIIAVIDSGVDLSHTDNLFLPGYDFVSDPVSAFDGDGWDNNPTDSYFIWDPHGISHGTHVSGTIAALTNNNEGVAGVCPYCNLVPVRALGYEGKGNNGDIAEAMVWAAGLNPNLVNPNPAQIINMSLGGSSTVCLQEYLDAIEYIEQNTAAPPLIVVATGNSDLPYIPSPANCPNVLAVGATGIDGFITDYSNYGSLTHVMAPGGGNAYASTSAPPEQMVLSTVENSVYWVDAGTSMAAPHVAGVAGLMIAASWAADLPITRDDLLYGLRNTAIDLGDTGPDILYGKGQVNAYQAVKWAAALPDTAPTLIFNTQTLNLTHEQTTAQFVAINPSSQTVFFDQPLAATSSGGNWLSAVAEVKSTTLDGQPILFLAVTVSADRTGLEAGIYNGTLTINHTGGPTMISVSMQVQSNPKNVGIVSVLALDEDYNISAWDETVFSEGYSFTISNLPQGVYGIVAGTDNDQDDTICEESDWCGVYGFDGQAGSVSVTAGQTASGIDVAIGNSPAYAKASSTDLHGTASPTNGLKRIDKDFLATLEYPSKQGASE